MQHFNLTIYIISRGDPLINMYENRNYDVGVGDRHIFQACKTLDFSRYAILQLHAVRIHTDRCVPILYLKFEIHRGGNPRDGHNFRHAKTIHQTYIYTSTYNNAARYIARVSGNLFCRREIYFVVTRLILSQFFCTLSYAFRYLSNLKTWEILTKSKTNEGKKESYKENNVRNR